MSLVALLIVVRDRDRVIRVGLDIRVLVVVVVVAASVHVHRAHAFVHGGTQVKTEENEALMDFQRDGVILWCSTTTTLPAGCSSKALDCDWSWIRNQSCRFIFFRFGTLSGTQRAPSDSNKQRRRLSSTTSYLDRPAIIRWCFPTHDMRRDSPASVCCCCVT